MIKKFFLILCVGFCTFILIFCWGFNYSQKNDDSKNSSSDNFKELIQQIEQNIVYEDELKNNIDKKLNEELKKEIEKYNSHVSVFEELDVLTLKAKIASEDKFILYTGRSTCPWCRKLVSILSELALKNDILIYYLDSENTDENINLKEFRDTYEIETVPSIDYFGENNEHIKIEFNINSDDFKLEALEKAIKAYK